MFDAIKKAFSGIVNKIKIASAYALAVTMKFVGPAVHAANVVLFGFIFVTSFSVPAALLCCMSMHSLSQILKLMGRYSFSEVVEGWKEILGVATSESAEGTERSSEDNTTVKVTTGPRDIATSRDIKITSKVASTDTSIENAVLA